jgi:hypothetical protein
MEPHSHPSYDQTFERIATILDVIAQEQLEQQHAHAQAQLEQRQAHAQAQLEQRHAQLEQRQAAQAASARMDRIEAALQANIAHARERDEETTDKLNALIELMNRHHTEQH